MWRDAHDEDGNHDNDGRTRDGNERRSRVSAARRGTIVFGHKEEHLVAKAMGTSVTSDDLLANELRVDLQPNCDEEVHLASTRRGVCLPHESCSRGCHSEDEEAVHELIAHHTPPFIGELHDVRKRH